MRFTPGHGARRLRAFNATIGVCTGAIQMALASTGAGRVQWTVCLSPLGAHLEGLGNARRDCL
jgi:hypothetical protein